MPIQRIAYHGMSHRLAEESQLLAEQKWIVETLTNIRNQRNSLQIERLHLESMKTQLKIETEKRSNGGESTVANVPSEVETQNQLTGCCPIEFEVPIVNMDDEICNEEELDLTVSQRIFQNPDQTTFDMEEYDEDDENVEDVFIDMNMLMNGKQFDTSNNAEQTKSKESKWNSG